MFETGNVITKKKKKKIYTTFISTQDFIFTDNTVWIFGFQAASDHKINIFNWVIFLFFCFLHGKHGVTWELCLVRKRAHGRWEVTVNEAKCLDHCLFTSLGIRWPMSHFKLITHSSINNRDVCLETVVRNAFPNLEHSYEVLSFCLWCRNVVYCSKNRSKVFKYVRQTEMVSTSQFALSQNKVHSFDSLTVNALFFKAYQTSHLTQLLCWRNATRIWHHHKTQVTDDGLVDVLGLFFPYVTRPCQENQQTRQTSWSINISHRSIKYKSTTGDSKTATCGGTLPVRLWYKINTEIKFILASYPVSIYKPPPTTSSPTWRQGEVTGQSEEGFTLFKVHGQNMWLTITCLDLATSTDLLHININSCCPSGYTIPWQRWGLTVPPCSLPFLCPSQIRYCSSGWAWPWFCCRYFDPSSLQNQEPHW